MFLVVATLSSPSHTAHLFVNLFKEANEYLTYSPRHTLAFPNSLVGRYCYDLLPVQSKPRQTITRLSGILSDMMPI